MNGPLYRFRQALISALSALYAMLLVIMSLGFEVSIIAVDSVNGSNYDVSIYALCPKKVYFSEPVRFQFFYIYLYAVALLFLGYCYAFLLKNDSNTISWSILCLHRRKVIKSESEAPPVDFARRRSRAMSLKRKITHSAKGAGSLYLRLGCVGKPTTPVQETS